jgi:hypothetical protein
MLWVRISIRVRCTTLCDKDCQWFATGRWFSLGIAGIFKLFLWQTKTAEQIILFHCLLICLMVLNATFNNISAISWRSALLVEETGVPRENHRPVANHWQFLSHNVVQLTLIEIRTHNISGSNVIVYDFRQKNMFDSCLPSVVLFTLFVFICVYWYPTHIELCFYFVCLRLVCPMLPGFLNCPILIAPSVFSNVYLRILLDCPILIVPSVFSNVYLQFLWIGTVLLIHLQNMHCVCLFCFVCFTIGT